jgi:hypothetical protein
LTLSGNDVTRVIRVAGDVEVELSGLAITRGRAGTGWIEDSSTAGGGVFNNGGALTLTNVRLTDNVAVGGGAICSNGRLSLIDSTVSGNLSRNTGGPALVAGIWNTRYNFATGGNDRPGILTVKGTTISGNVGQEGIGGILSEGTATMSNTTVSGNVGTATSVQHGTGTGGVEAAGTLTLVNSTVFGNGGEGEAEGCGIVAYAAGTVSLRNTLVAGNTRPGGACDINGTVASSSTWNVIGDAATAGGLVNGVNNNVVGVSWVTVLSPVLGNNGGPTATHALLAGSVAVDRIPAAACTGPEGSPLTTDQRGMPRPAGPAPQRCDVGSFERQPSDP